MSLSQSISKFSRNSAIESLNSENLLKADRLDVKRKKKGNGGKIIYLRRNKKER